MLRGMWLTGWGSNPRPPAHQTGAQTTELPVKYLKAAAGVEPTYTRSAIERIADLPDGRMFVERRPTLRRRGLGSARRDSNPHFLPVLWCTRQDSNLHLSPV